MFSPNIDGTEPIGTGVAQYMVVIASVLNGYSRYWRAAAPSEALTEVSFRQSLINAACGCVQVAAYPLLPNH